MNLTSLKLDLSIQMINQTFDNHAIDVITNKISSYEEVGSLLSTTLTNTSILNTANEHQDYNIKFENVVVDIQLVNRIHNNCSFVSNIELATA